MTNGLTITLGRKFELAKEKYGWDDDRLAEHLGISPEQLTDLFQKSIPCNGTLISGSATTGRQYIPDGQTPDVGSVWLLADRYGMDDEQRDRLLKIISPPMWNDPLAV